jgi:mannose-6-phosphate isomerase-like protein (cupin superfamily)
MRFKSRALLLLLVAAVSVADEERRTDPTFLRRSLREARDVASDVTTATCRYRPLFGEGDPDANALRGIARFGEIRVSPGGASAIVAYEREEQVYVILEGEGFVQYGEVRHPVRANDFLYLPPNVRHGLAGSSEAPCRAIVMGFRLPKGAIAEAPPALLIANIDDVPKQTLGSHPSSTLYQLLMGAVSSRRDHLAAARVLTSLFTMEFLPGGTNAPHHHDHEEEIYLVLNGRGEMVAGGGLDGIEGRHPAKAGDAYFFRLNCTVGFYAASAKGEETARILAVRSLYPFPQEAP